MEKTQAAKKTSTSKELLAEYYDQSARLLPETFYEKEILGEEQLRELTHLRETISYERFFFVVNLQKMEIEHINGVGKWLGYNEGEFNFFRYLKIVHPAHVAMHTLSSKAMLEGLMEGKWNIEFMKHRYVTKIALQHKNGHYLHCKRLACVFQYDKNNRLLEYINEFTIIGRYNDESFSVSAASDEGENKDWLAELMTLAKKIFGEKNFFSFQELRVLRKYAYNEDISVEQIAKSFRIEKSTVITYNKRILEKAESLYLKHSSARKVGIALRDAGLL
jgi:hypothetical protein